MKRFVSRYVGVFLAFVAMFCFTTLASAQSGSPVPVTTLGGLSHATWEWFLFGTSILVYAATWVDPANKDTPFAWQGKSRIAAFTILGAAVGVAHYVQNHDTVPWTESLLTGVMTIGVPMAMHFSTAIAKNAAARAAAGVSALLLVGGLSLGATGCATLFPGLTTGNPVADMTAFVQVAETADGIAVEAWTLAQPLIPAASLASAQAAYTKVQDAYQAAVALAEDAIQAYQGGAAENWGTVMAAVTSAVDAVITVLGQFGVSVLGAAKVVMLPPEFAVHLSTLKAAQTTLHAYRAP